MMENEDGALSQSAPGAMLIPRANAATYRDVQHAPI
jgi:hypothetical protein